MTTSTLTPQQESFVASYILNGGNATQAAIEARYSPKTAKQQGSRLLTNVDVQQAIERKQSKLAIQAEYSIHRWREELLGYIADAHAANSHSAVFKGMELLGRHIGALNDRASFSADEAKAWAWLGAAMESMRASISPSPGDSEQQALPPSDTSG